MPGTNLNLDLPSLSDTMATIVSKLVIALTVVEDDLAPKILPSEIDINAALVMNGNALMGAGSLQLVGGNAPSAAGSIYYSGGEFYAIDSAGVVQLTLNGSLNITAAHGIVGDYGQPGNSASVNYNNTSGEYRFYSGTGTAYGAADVGYVAYEVGTGGTTAARLHANPSTATLVDYYLPAAPPTASSGIGIDSTGHIVYKGAQTVVIPAVAAAVGGTAAFTTSGMVISESTSSSPPEVGFPVILPVGSVITGYRVIFNKLSTGAITQTSKLVTIVGGSASPFTFTSGNANGINAPGPTQCAENATTSMAPVTVTLGSSYYVDLQASGTWAGGTDHIHHCEVTYLPQF